MNALTIGAMMALATFQQTDTTFAVGSAEILQLEALGGSITVDVWDRDEIRVQAEHSARSFIEIDRGRREIEVASEARRGPANIVDFHVTVPRTFALELEGHYTDIVVEGADGTVDIETLQGDITLRGGRGQVTLSNTIGDILVEDAEANIEIESSAADVRIRNSGGAIYVETTGGSVVLENVHATTVDVGSTGGRVYFDGTISEGGTYFFGSHGGTITIVLPDDTDAMLGLATIYGSIVSNLSGAAERFEGGERHTVRVGSGGTAIIEAESYGGRISIMRRGSDGSEAPAMRRRDAREERDLIEIARMASAAEVASHVEVEVSHAHERTLGAKPATIRR